MDLYIPKMRHQKCKWMKGLSRNLHIAFRLFSGRKKYDKSIHPDIWMELVFWSSGTSIALDLKVNAGLRSKGFWMHEWQEFPEESLSWVGGGDILVRRNCRRAGDGEGGERLLGIAVFCNTCLFINVHIESIFKAVVVPHCLGGSQASFIVSYKHSHFCFLYQLHSKIAKLFLAGLTGELSLVIKGHMHVYWAGIFNCWDIEKSQGDGHLCGLHGVKL